MKVSKEKHNPTRQNLPEQKNKLTKQTKFKSKSKIPKIKTQKCPLCNAMIKDFRINFTEKITMCEDYKCTYPFGTDNFKIEAYNGQTITEQIADEEISSTNHLSNIDNHLSNEDFKQFLMGTDKTDDAIPQENVSPLTDSTSARNTSSLETNNQLDDFSFFQENLDLFI